MRKLGIPTVLDRLIQQAMFEVMGPIFEERFSDSSYGFRAGRSAHEAVRKAQEYVQSGKTQVVDIDIEKFFDQVNQDLLMDRIARVIRNKRVLRLIGRYLRAGAVVEGKWEPSTVGTPQGGPLWPLLGNIYLDPLDQELEKRGLSFCRYADDCNIYGGSSFWKRRGGGARAPSIGDWIERRLRLRVNRTKSGRGRPWERKFLGFSIDREGRIMMAKESLKGYKQKVRELWRGNQSRTSTELRDRWLRWLRGWWGYYRLAENRRELLRLEGWTRRHIRKYFWLRWHSKKGRLKALRRLGVNERLLKLVPRRRGSWFLSRNPLMQSSLSNAVLRRHGFLVPSQLAG